ncbi:MAG: hypothetical protein M3Y91_09300 [Actinomycetota bacterium]|nr:hypothetical protein [Actinomycetota bacterium]
MNRTRRLFALGALAVAVSVAAAGCDSSPTAASINGKVIKQTTLQAELRGRAGNKAYVAAVDQAGAQSGGTTIAGLSTASYSSGFAAGVLDQMVEDAAIRQYLTAHDALPSASALAAARGVEEVGAGAYWQGFPASIRDEFVSALADRAVLEPPPTSTADARSALMNHQANFFSRVCTRKISVSMQGTNGGIDFAASRDKANKIESDFNGGTLGGDTGGGSVTCYTQPQLEDQSQALFNEVLGLAPGEAAAPVRTSYGYNVLAVDSRDLQTFAPGTAAVLAFAINSSNQNGYTPALVRVLQSAKVKVNPAFGTWNQSQLTVQTSAVPGQIANKLQGGSSQAPGPG